MQNFQKLVAAVATLGMVGSVYAADQDRATLQPMVVVEGTLAFGRDGVRMTSKNPDDPFSCGVFLGENLINYNLNYNLEKLETGKEPDPVDVCSIEGMVNAFGIIKLNKTAKVYDKPGYIERKISTNEVLANKLLPIREFEEDAILKLAQGESLEDRIITSRKALNNPSQRSGLFPYLNTR